MRARRARQAQLRLGLVRLGYKFAKLFPNVRN